MEELIGEVLSALVDYSANQSAAAEKKRVNSALDAIQQGIKDILKNLLELRVFISQALIDQSAREYMDVVGQDAKFVISLLSKGMSQEARKQVGDAANRLMEASGKLGRPEYGYYYYHSVLVGYFVYLKAMQIFGFQGTEIAAIAAAGEEYCSRALDPATDSIGGGYAAATNAADLAISLYNQRPATGWWRVTSQDAMELGRWNGEYPGGGPEWCDTDEGTWAQHPWFQNCWGYGKLQEARKAFEGWYATWRATGESETARAAGIWPAVEEISKARGYFRSLQPHQSPLQAAATLQASELAAKLSLMGQQSGTRDPSVALGIGHSLIDRSRTLR